jgi:hypothetical protein
MKLRTIDYFKLHNKLCPDECIPEKDKKICQLMKRWAEIDMHSFDLLSEEDKKIAREHNR